MNTEQLIAMIKYAAAVSVHAGDLIFTEIYQILICGLEEIQYHLP